MKLTLVGNPRSTQTCYRHACRGGFPSVYMSKVCKDLKEDYQWQVRGQYKGAVTTSPLSIKMVIYFGTKRKADIDNFNKLIFDAMTGIVYEDDSQIVELNIKKSYDKEAPRIELDIKEL